MKPLEWEQIDDYHQRCKVIGGWLVKAYEDATTQKDTYAGLRAESGYEWRISMCFVPDEGH